MGGDYFMKLNSRMGVMPYDDIWNTNDYLNFRVSYYRNNVEHKKISLPLAGVGLFF